MKSKKNIRFETTIVLCMCIIVTLIGHIGILSVNAASSDPILRTYSTTIKAASSNTKLEDPVKKTFPDQNYSTIIINESSSVNKMKVWLNVSGVTVSRPNQVFYPDGVEYKVHYKDGTTVTKNSSITFWAEQYNVKSKYASGIIYGA